MKKRIMKNSKRLYILGRTQFIIILALIASFFLISIIFFILNIEGVSLAMGLLFLGCGIIYTVGEIIIGAIKPTFVQLNKEGIELRSLFNKEFKKEKWEDLRLLCYRHIWQHNARCLNEWDCIVMFFSQNINIKTEDYKYFLYEPHVAYLFNSKRNRRILKEYLPKKLHYLLDDDTQYKVAYTFGFLVSDVMFILCIMGFILIVSILLGIYFEVCKNIAFLIFYIAFVVCGIGGFPILYIKMEKYPKYLEMNKTTIKKKYEIWTESRIDVIVKWEDLRSMPLTKDKYVVMNFSDCSDEKLRSMTIKEIKKIPLILLLKKTKRNVKLLREYLPEEFKSCLG